MLANKHQANGIPTAFHFEKFKSVKISVVGQPSLATTTFIGAFVPYVRPHQTDISSDMVNIKTVLVEREGGKMDLGFIEMESQSFLTPFRKEMYAESQIVVVVLEKTLNFIKEFRKWAEETYELGRSASPKRCLILMDVKSKGEQKRCQSRNFSFESLQ